MISFDVFDTLILRNVYKPTDIFKAMEKSLFDNFAIQNFYEHRIEAEKKARQKVKNGECNLDEIYNELADILHDKIDFVKQLELKTEDKFLVANSFMKEVFYYALLKGKRIVLISDMYLSKEFLDSVLKKTGYENFELFISNEYKVNKGSGELYEIVEKECGLKKSEWLHIGDNPDSDYTAAIRFGISAYNYKNVSKYDESNPKTLGESIITAIRNNLLYAGNTKDYWETFGIKYVFPIYFGFTSYIYELTKESDNLFFLARDGYAIKQVYENICQKRNNNIFTQYIYCSRQSVQMPCMALEKEMDSALEFLTAKNEFIKNDNITLKQLLNNVKLDLAKVPINLVKTFGFESIDDILDYNKYFLAQKLIGYFSETIKGELLKESFLCKKYLEEIGAKKFDTINIMDVGWSGSIQKSISTLLQKNVRGYYLGTIENSGISNMFGWVFNKGLPIENKTDIYNNAMMYELIFSAPHGSCSGYIEQDGKIQPLLRENVCFNEIIKKFQRSAIKACECAIEYYDYVDFINPEFCTAPYTKFIEKKNKEDVEQFEKLNNDVSIGNSKMYPYVAVITDDDVKKGVGFIKKKKTTGIWQGAYMYAKDMSSNNKGIIDYSLKHDYEEEYIKFDLKYSKVYFDFGEGFAEHASVIVKNEFANKKIKFALNLPLEVVAIRIDPTEQKYISASKIKVKVNGKRAKYTIPVYNSRQRLKSGSKIKFETKDPSIVVEFSGRMEELEFEANIRIL